VSVTGGNGVGDDVGGMVGDGVSVDDGIGVLRTCVSGVSAGIGPLQAKLRNTINTARHAMIRQVAAVMVEVVLKRPAMNLRSLLPLSLSRFIFLPRE
jgi:hypothetical protein